MFFGMACNAFGMAVGMFVWNGVEWRLEWFGMVVGTAWNVFGMAVGMVWNGFWNGLGMAP